MRAPSGSNHGYHIWVSSPWRNHCTSNTYPIRIRCFSDIADIADGISLVSQGSQNSSYDHIYRLVVFSFIFILMQVFSFVSILGFYPCVRGFNGCWSWVMLWELYIMLTINNPVIVVLTRVYISNQGNQGNQGKHLWVVGLVRCYRILVLLAALVTTVFFSNYNVLD